MKKLLTLAVVAVLICSVAVVAGAAVVAPEGVEATTLFDFSTFSGTSNANETSGWWVPDGNDHSLTFADGKLTFGKDAAGKWAAIPDMSEDSQALTKNASGWGFYAKGGSQAQTLAVSFNDVSGNNQIAKVGAAYDLVYSNGNIARRTIVETNFNQGGVVIPKNFEGYVYIPFAAYKLNDATKNEDYDPAVGVKKPIYALDTDVVNLTIGEFFAWTGELPEQNVSDDELNDTADISVIAYAAAAITGLGALVVAKKR